MPEVYHRPRIYAFPYHATLFDARLDALAEEAGSREQDIIFKLRVLRQVGQPEPLMLDGMPHELVRGEYVPMRLRFQQASWLWRTGPFEQFDALPPDHGARRLFGVLHSRQHIAGEFYLASTDTPDAGVLGLRARSAVLEFDDGDGDGDPQPAELLRRWAATPPLPAGIVPHRLALYRRFGGDPISIHLGRRVFHRRLFIGGLHHQQESRPTIDAVLNLCGVESMWHAHSGRHIADRFSCKGEGAVGMRPDDLLEEASWVVSRLRVGQRVLVHCYAGFNRSTTVCCAALMLLEGLSADEALARVRQHHPLAWPDPYHWFALRWLQQQLSLPQTALAVPDGHRAPLLRGTAPIQ
jgi:hypothetical protein